MYQQVPLSNLDREAFVRYMDALANGRDKLPQGLEELNKLLKEARRQALLFYLQFGTWDFALEVEVYRLQAAKDPLILAELQKYR